MEPKRLEKTDTVTNKTEYAIGDFVEVQVRAARYRQGEKRHWQEEKLYKPKLGQIVGLKNVQTGERDYDDEGYYFDVEFQITLWEVKTGYANKPLLCLPSGIIRSELTERLPVLQTR